MLISDLVAKGLECPNCGAKKIRSGYHDFQHMDSFVCEICGLRWQEDFRDFKERAWMLKERRFVWVMCDTNNPLIPVMNCDSSDECSDRNRFIRKGIRNWKANVVLP